ncbi:MAG TPA: DUF4167 domain-containing protein [Microvirga sp.]|jgi:hypothetical protein|nr:DUF4167 domain-containing protein [Microvirga sp.]
MRGRNRSNNKGPNPLTRSYESNGPDVKIRGTAQHIAEKYSQLARDAQSSGDPVAAENYHQHAEHYYRIIAAAQEQLREQYGYQRPFDEEGDEDGFGEDSDFGSQPQPFEARQDNRQDQRPDNRQDSRQDDDRRERYDRTASRDRYGRNPRDTRPDVRQDARQDNRQDGNRSDGARDDRQGGRPERGPRPEANGRPEPNGRADYRRDRRDEPAASEEPGSSLPAFLTNPVRAPVLEGAEAAVPAVGGPEALNGEGNGEYRTRRRRRTRRGFGDETGAEPAGEFVPEIETPPAE